MLPFFRGHYFIFWGAVFWELDFLVDDVCFCDEMVDSHFIFWGVIMRLLI